MREATLFLSQQLGRLYPEDPPGRDVTGDEGDHSETSGHGGERHGIGR